MSVSVSVDTTKLNEIIAKLPGNRDKIVRETAVHILGQARMRTPVGKPKTDGRGHLRDNSNVNMEYGGYAIVEYYPEYAPYVELGTWKMAARPYLKPAVEAETDLLTKRIKEELITK